MKIFTRTHAALFVIILFLAAFLAYPLAFSVREAFSVKKSVVIDGEQKQVDKFSLANFYFFYGHIEASGGWGAAALRSARRTIAVAAVVIALIFVTRPGKSVRRFLLCFIAVTPLTIFFEGESVVAESMRNSFLIATLSTAMSLAVGIPLAWIFVRKKFPGRNLLAALLLVPMIMPPFVGAVGMRQIVADQGPVNIFMAILQTPAMLPLTVFQDKLSSILELLGNLLPLTDCIFQSGGSLFASEVLRTSFQRVMTIEPTFRFDEMGLGAIIFLEVLHLYPIIYMNIASSLARVDPAMEESARSLGDSGARLFRRITLPLLMPGIFAGASIVFIWAFTDLGTPLIFQFDRTVAVQIFTSLDELDSNRFAYALIMLILVMTAAIFMIIRKFIGEKGFLAEGKGAAGIEEKSVGGKSMALIYLFVGSVTLLALTPHLSVIIHSVSAPGSWTGRLLPGSLTTAHYQKALGDDLAIGSVKRSLVYSFGSTFLDILLGVSIAWLLARAKFKGKNLLDAVVMLPLALPGLVLAFGYMAAYSGLEFSPLLKRLPENVRSGIIDVVDPTRNPTLLLIISYAVRRLPFMVRAAYAGFMQTSVGLEEASASLGAKPLKTFRRITLPLVAANLLGGIMLCFSFSMLEVSDSLILAQTRQYYPISKAIYTLSGMMRGGTYMACALGVWAMLFLASSLFLAYSFMGKRMGSMFRI